MDGGKTGRADCGGGGGRGWRVADEKVRIVK